MENNENRKYNVIYVYKINDPSHNGLLKIGKTSFNSTDVNTDPTKFGEDDHFLYYIAKNRVDQQNQTAGNNRTIVYWTLGVKDNGEDFDDNEVDRLLQRNGISHVDMNGSTEWYNLTVEVAKQAINAVKKGIRNLDFDSEVQLTANEDNIVSTTLSWFKKENRFFWSCNDETDTIIPTLFLVKKSKQIIKFNHVLILGSNDQFAKQWLENYHKIHLSNLSYFFYTKDNSIGGVSFSKDNKINQETKFVLYLAFNDWNEFKDTIRMHNWDLIVINELNENVDTSFENNISELSANAKWLYFSHVIPGSYIANSQSNNVECENQQTEINNNQNESSHHDLDSEEQIYFNSLSQDLDLHFTKPISLVIENNLPMSCNSWNSALMNIYNYLFKKYGPSIFEKISSKDISINEDDFNASRLISGTQYWANTCFDANHTYDKCRDLLKLFNIPLEKSYLIIAKKD